MMGFDGTWCGRCKVVSTVLWFGKEGRCWGGKGTGSRQCGLEVLGPGSMLGQRFTIEGISVTVERCMLIVQKHSRCRKKKRDAIFSL